MQRTAVPIRFRFTDREQPCSTSQVPSFSRSAQVLWSVRDGIVKREHPTHVAIVEGTWTTIRFELFVGMFVGNFNNGKTMLQWRVELLTKALSISFVTGFCETLISVSAASGSAIAPRHKRQL